MRESTEHQRKEGQCPWGRNSKLLWVMLLQVKAEHPVWDSWPFWISAVDTQGGNGSLGFSIKGL